MEQVVITVGPGGKTTIEVVGGQGPQCATPNSLSMRIAQGLGTVQRQELKPEYHEDPVELVDTEKELA